MLYFFSGYCDQFDLMWSDIAASLQPEDDIIMAKMDAVSNNPGSFQVCLKKNYQKGH